MAGLGLFLYGMVRIEGALKGLAGRRFKIFIRDYTTNRFVGIFNGAFATAVLQSSSIVVLMVIAFVGAGVLSLSNSLGIILGANLGTTVTGWLVSSLGFDTNIQDYVFPIIGLGSLGLVFSGGRVWSKNLFGFWVAFGLIMMGLGFMKDSMENIASAIDIGRIRELGPIAFYFFGLLVTGLIQSSSAMMTIALSALNAGIIDLSSAALIVVGADLGTTVTALIASMQGGSVRGRVGLAHFFINVGSGVIALISKSWLIDWIVVDLGIANPLYALVAFHSSFNAIGIIAFWPFLGWFERFLNLFFQSPENRVCNYIHKVSPDVPEAAIVAIRRDMRDFFDNVLNFNSEVLQGEGHRGRRQEPSKLQAALELLSHQDQSSKYDRIKRTEGELVHYFARLQKEELAETESRALNRFIMALRNGVQSAKSFKDIQHNLNEFRQSILPEEERFMSVLSHHYRSVEKDLDLAFANGAPVEKLNQTDTDNDKAFHSVNKWVYESPRTEYGADSRLPTFLNVNREVYRAYRLLNDSLRDISQLSLLNDWDGE